MKQGTNLKRSRGRGGRKPGGTSRQHVFDSNGPSVRIRGSAMQIYEKYSQLSRDNVGNDRVASENMAQHAEHYFRVAQQQVQQQQQQQGYTNNNGSAQDAPSHQGPHDRQGPQDRQGQQGQPRNPQPYDDSGHSGHGNTPVNGADRETPREDADQRSSRANGAAPANTSPEDDAGADQPPRRPRRARPRSSAKSAAKVDAPADAQADTDGGSGDED